MEIANFLKVITRHFSLIGIALLFGILCASMSNNGITETYQSRQNITVVATSTASDEVFDFHNYYGEYSSNHITSTILGWFMSDSFTSKITRNFPTASVFATKLERANFIITSNTKRKDDLNKIADTAIAQLQNKITAYNKAADAQYKLIADERIISTNRIAANKLYILFAMMSIIAGVALAYLIELFKGVIQTNAAASNAVNEKVSECLPKHFNEKHLEFLEAISKNEDTAIFIHGLKTIPKGNIFEQNKSVIVTDNFHDVKNQQRRNNIVMIKRGITNSLTLQKIYKLLGDKQKHLVIID